MSTAPNTPAAQAPGARQKALTVVGLVVLIGLAYGGYTWYAGRSQESTDNAYVQGNVIQITPQIGGTVTAILADDTDFVKAGQPLVQLDPADAKVALQLAQANLAFYSQVLTGDAADGYPGCKGIGPVAASKALADCETEEDMWLAVQRAYLKAGHPVDFAVQMARCARILRPGEYDHNRRMPRLWTPPSYGA